MHDCPKSLVELKKKKDDDDDSDDDDDQNPSHKKKKKQTKNISEAKAPEKKLKVPNTTTISSKGTKDIVSEVKRISRFKSSTSNRIVVAENHDDSPIQLKSKPIPFFRYQIHLPTNYKPFKISDMFSESKNI